MYKLVALDIDNTLTNDAGNVSAENIEAIRAVQAKHVIIALASTRPISGITAISEQIGSGIYSVAYCGAVIRLPDGSELRRLNLAPSAAENILQFANDRSINMTIIIDDELYQTEYGTLETEIPILSTYEIKDVFRSGRSPLLMLVAGDRQTREIYDCCIENENTQVDVSLNILNDGSYASAIIVDKKAQKGKALLSLCSHLGIQPRHMLVMGDNESDLSMFQIAGMSIAVGNGTPSILAAADQIAPTSNNSGVAWALRKFVLDEQ